MTDWDVEAVEQPQLWEIVLGRIREAILGGTLPSGSRLVERDLAARFGTSRGPIRDAIRELAREGLVVELPRRGTVVSTITARDLLEAYLVREALEIGACKTVVSRTSDADLAALSSQLDAFERSSKKPTGTIEAARHDLAFHRKLVELTGNTRMIAVYEQMLSTTMLLLRTAAERAPALQTVMESWVHLDILAALVARDVTAAQAAISEHYRHAEERLFGRLEPEQIDAPPPA